jgi:hypothetical protein
VSKPMSTEAFAFIGVALAAVVVGAATTLIHMHTMSEGYQRAYQALYRAYDNGEGDLALLDPSAIAADKALFQPFQLDLLHAIDAYNASRLLSGPEPHIEHIAQCAKVLDRQRYYTEGNNTALKDAGDAVVRLEALSNQYGRNSALTSQARDIARDDLKRSDEYTKDLEGNEKQYSDCEAFARGLKTK